MQLERGFIKGAALAHIDEQLKDFFILEDGRAVGVLREFLVNDAVLVHDLEVLDVGSVDGSNGHSQA